MEWEEDKEDNRIAAYDSVRSLPSPTCSPQTLPFWTSHTIAVLSTEPVMM